MKIIMVVLIVILASSVFIFNKNVADNDTGILVSIEPSNEDDNVDMAFEKLSKNNSDSMEKTINNYNNKLHEGKRLEALLRQIQRSDDDQIKQDAFDELVVELDMAREEHRITNLEALTVHLTALKSFYDRQDYDHYAEELKLRYTIESEQRWDHYLENRDATFLTYKQMESELLARVKTFEEFPEGMTKKEYLEKEIAKIKEKAYGTADDSSADLVGHH